MINLLDYILDLFRDEGQAQAFVANPDQALADAGLSTVSSAHCSLWPRRPSRVWHGRQR